MFEICSNYVQNEISLTALRKFSLLLPHLTSTVVLFAGRCYSFSQGIYGYTGEHKLWRA